LTDIVCCLEFETDTNYLMRSNSSSIV